MYADLVLWGGKIITMDEAESTAQTVAVKYGRIIAVGKDEDVKPLVGPRRLMFEAVIEILDDFVSAHLSIAMILHADWIFPEAPGQLP